MTFSKRMLCFIIFTCFMHLTKSSNSRKDTLLQGYQLAATNHLISSSGVYTLRFFQLDGSEDNSKFYLGISFNNYYVWVANRDNPIHDDPGVLTIDECGNLKILCITTIMLYSTEAARNKSVSATLLDTGNFVLHELNSNRSVKRVLWQSFDYPMDTLVPGMKIGYDKLTGHTWSLTARRSFKSLWSGSFSLRLDLKTNQLVSRWRGTIVWSSGPWRNGSFINLNSYKEQFNFTFFSNENVTYFEYASSSSHMTMGPLGTLNASGVSYSCVDGDIPPGCSMPRPSKCREDDDLYLPNWNSIGAMSRKGFIFDESENLTISDCWMKCLSNCSCEAYTYANQDATGCEIWTKGTAHFVATDSAIGRPIFFFRTETKATEKKSSQSSIIGENIEISVPNDEGREQWKKKRTGGGMHIFDFTTILEASDNFSCTNKIGEGGFGPVYKGKLSNGQEIAIKRLSKSSGQGLIEFKNEAMLVVKLQHTNLVRLLGCCTDREERILVYEFMSNRSLNLYLFDSNKRNVLEWNTRYKIIEGVTQGLVYLHQYSRLKVIHRDLKASNILLDNELNPKISDFGMARIFGLSESEEKTNRVVGTFGYMSPEYAMRGVISTKTDVYSFGILLLEIVSGKKNNCNYPLNLLGYAWQLWNHGEALKLIDSTINGSCLQIQVLRCIHVGLLCTQDRPRDRPTMLEVISFLSNEIIQLPQPIQPSFYTITNMKELEQNKSSSVNEITISDTSGR
ncbi:G-type lectin S-receptor-like serine/threonine-protein kinase At1g67520 [Abrus precatorius]|uniref:Receptor-like serine/threonine-protein kinase n=1 Tax=Abrus precatorius TaxID=3816 RepID=A0A8B8K2A2_ABRPR|nr:G-type lectin S-receptor-like serine/threonine-protein kinase At1g67520 [Abrus precatorius]